MQEKQTIVKRLLLKRRRHILVAVDLNKKEIVPIDTALGQNIWYVRANKRIAIRKAIELI